jgi:hypothetical protein
VISDASRDTVRPSFSCEQAHTCHSTRWLVRTSASFGRSSRLRQDFGNDHDGRRDEQREGIRKKLGSDYAWASKYPGSLSFFPDEIDRITNAELVIMGVPPSELMHMSLQLREDVLEIHRAKQALAHGKLPS